VVVNLQRFLSSGVLTALSGVSMKLGFTKNPLSVFFTTRFQHQISTEDNSPHEIERNHQLILALTDEQVAKPKLYPSMKDFALVRVTEEYVTMSPTSVWFTKSLLQSAALMKGAIMNYVNDSAPLHLASAMNAPVTAVFLSTVPQFGFTPLSDNSSVCETSLDLPCRPCGLHGKGACPEGHFKCAEIEVYPMNTSKALSNNHE